MKEVEIKTMQIPQLFAYGGEYNEVDSEKSGFSYKEGIPMMYSSRTGKKVRRADVNGIGRMATRSKFFNQMGGYYTFNEDVCTSIGGYPLGAVLHYKEPSTGLVRMVRSLVENNAFNFVTEDEHIDGVNWEFVDEIPPSGVRPKVFADLNGLRTGKLTSDEELVIDCDSIMAIQSGVKLSYASTQDSTTAEVWLSVKKRGEEDFHSAVMLAFIAPLSTSYSMVGSSSEYIYTSVEKCSNYSTMYSSSPMQLYLNSGDVVKITADINFPYEADYAYYPLIG